MEQMDGPVLDNESTQATTWSVTKKSFTQKPFKLMFLCYPGAFDEISE